MLPVDVKPLTVTSQPQLFIGDMLQQLHNNQIAGTAKLPTPIVSSQLKGDVKREDALATSSAYSQITQGKLYNAWYVVCTYEANHGSVNYY